MGLYRRGTTWWIAIYTPAGRLVQSTGTSNRKDAEVIHDELKRRANAQRHGVILAPKKLTFAEVAATFLKQTGSHKYHVERLKALLPTFGPIPISAISRAFVDGYRTERRKGVSAATVNRDVAVMKHILYWALDEGWIAANPLMRYRRLAEPKRPRRVLGVAEEEQLLRHALPHVYQAVVLALDTGMRRGEILSLRREYLDPYRKVLVVSQSKTAGGTGREIPWSRRVERMLKPLAGGSGPVVLFREAAIRNLKKGWRRAVRRSQIPAIRFHDLRHTFNTRLMEAGVSQDIRKALMGHADADINDTYTHVELPAKRAAIVKLDSWREQQSTELIDEHQHQNNKESQGGNHGTLATENDEGDARRATRSPYQTH